MREEKIENRHSGGFMIAWVTSTFARLTSNALATNTGTLGRHLSFVAHAPRSGTEGLRAHSIAAANGDLRPSKISVERYPHRAPALRTVELTLKRHPSTCEAKDLTGYPPENPTTGKMKCCPHMKKKGERGFIEGWGHTIMSTSKPLLTIQENTLEESCKLVLVLRNLHKMYAPVNDIQKIPSKQPTTRTRCLVEVNMAQDIDHAVMLKLPNGEVFEQPVFYENLPRFCPHCKVVGHTEEGCNAKKSKAKITEPAQARDSVNAGEKGTDSQVADSAVVRGKGTQPEWVTKSKISKGTQDNVNPAKTPAIISSSTNKFSVLDRNPETEDELIQNLGSSAQVEDKSSDQVQAGNIQQKVQLGSKVYSQQVKQIASEELNLKLQQSSKSQALGTAADLKSKTSPGWDNDQGPRPFKFFNMWTKYEDFLNVVDSSWSMQVEGTAMFKLCRKLKVLKGPLKALNKMHFSHISARAAAAEEDLLQVQQQLHDNPTDSSLQIRVASLKKQSFRLAEANRSFCLQFGECSGLCISNTKSNVFMDGISRDIMEEIKTITGFSLGRFPFRYLGIPVAASRLTIEQFNPLITKISDYVSAWAGATLSYAGRSELIRSVL
ncbi:hypothetical protein Acr_11g0004620 [Actinidia rufa]|uniref:DUF4283 domain-containing protein n=1 Tax=Actinidia rufa TaxID=165716 RepID=A0A7J0FCJ3_9ERIC|nr:hypothetical protein Acr_11g0004620 [Actinidia rufa]